MSRTSSTGSSPASYYVVERPRSSEYYTLSSIRNRSCLLRNYFFPPYLYSRIPFMAKLWCGDSHWRLPAITIQISSPIILKFSFSYNRITPITFFLTLVHLGSSVRYSGTLETTSNRWSHQIIIDPLNQIWKELLTSSLVSKITISLHLEFNKTAISRALHWPLGIS